MKNEKEYYGVLNQKAAVFSVLHPELELNNSNNKTIAGICQRMKLSKEELRSIREYTTGFCPNLSKNWIDVELEKQYLICLILGYDKLKDAPEPIKNLIIAHSL